MSKRSSSKNGGGFDATQVGSLVLVVVLIWGLTTLFKRFFGSGSKGTNFAADSLYTRKYTTSAGAESLPKAETASGEAQGLPTCKFLLTAKKQLQRDYVLIVDRSGSMAGKRWTEAETAVKHLAPYICKFDPDGVTVFFFDHDYVRTAGVSTAQTVDTLFHQHRPRGSTNLAKVLDAAFEDHFAGDRGATTILVVTDGAPDSQANVEKVIRKAARSIAADTELSLSFIQIGNDQGAAKFLSHLDDGLTDLPFDIVDTITSDDARAISFNELVARSIYD